MPAALRQAARRVSVGAVGPLTRERGASGIGRRAALATVARTGLPADEEEDEGEDADGAVVDDEGVDRGEETGEKEEGEEDEDDEEGDIDNEDDDLEAEDDEDAGGGGVAVEAVEAAAAEDAVAAQSASTTCLGHIPLEWNLTSPAANAISLASSRLAIPSPRNRGGSETSPEGTSSG